MGELQVKVPRDRQGKYQTRVIPRSKRYEDELRQDIVMMFLGGMSTRTLSMISTKLLGRRISPSEVSRAGKELVQPVEAWRNRDLSLESSNICFAMVSSLR